VDRRQPEVGLKFTVQELHTTRAEVQLKGLALGYQKTLARDYG
jgi:hypothetical protein